MEVIKLVFEGDMCGHYKPQELTTHDLLELPHSGDVIKISGMWHYVITTCFSLDEKTATVHLGDSSDSLEHALKWPEKHYEQQVTEPEFVHY